MPRRLTLEVVAPDATVVIAGREYPVAAVTVDDVVAMVRTEAALAAATSAAEQADAIEAQRALVDRLLGPGAGGAMRLGDMTRLFTFLSSGGMDGSDADDAEPAGASGVVGEDAGLPPTPAR